MFPASLSKLRITSSLVRRKRGIERTRERGTEVADKITWKIFKYELKRWNSEILESENANSEILFLETNILTLWRNMISLLFCWRSEQRLAERWRGIGRWRSTGWRRRREKQKWPFGGDTPHSPPPWTLPPLRFPGTLDQTFDKKIKSNRPQIVRIVVNFK